MIESDTIRLLRECNVGVKMAIGVLKDTTKRLPDGSLREILQNSMREHDAFNNKINDALKGYGQEEKAPSPIARSMARMKVCRKLNGRNILNSAADLITDGCNAGTKKLHHYLNCYLAADGNAKGLAKCLIDIENRLADHVRPYL